MNKISSFVLPKTCRLIVLLFLIGTSSFSQELYTPAQHLYKVNEIPDPKNGGTGYVSNPDAILSETDVANLNSTIADVEQKTNVQIAVVIINNFDQDKEDFDFAYKLFNTWGIGSQKSNSGLLLFIAKDRRKYRFITGTGIEGILPDVTLKHIAEKNLLPAFRANDYGTGIINTINAIGVIVLNPEHKSELNQFFTQTAKYIAWDTIWVPSLIIILLFFGIFKLISRQTKKSNLLKHKDYMDPALLTGFVGLFFFIFISIFIFTFTGAWHLLKNIALTDIPLILFGILSVALFFRYLFFISTLRKAYNDDKNFIEAVNTFHKKNWWLIIFCPIILITLCLRLFKQSKSLERFTPILDRNKNEMIRVDRDLNIDGSPFLTKGQRKEEILKVYDYDIWESTNNDERIIKPWPAEDFDQFTECPSCYFRTYKLNNYENITEATYSHEGKAKITNECRFCNHLELIKWMILPILVRQSSSSSGSSGRNSSSSSSDSSSWGGGSSSGGGSGGSW